mmetsp:Transcript_532/g.861  ORF Transcript_532/g.861 Transcript_532/m.861 type:complete len:110 (-) Transcript_532:2792-3121(-)
MKNTIFYFPLALAFSPQDNHRTIVENVRFPSLFSLEDILRKKETLDSQQTFQGRNNRMRPFLPYPEIFPVCKIRMCFPPGFVGTSLMDMGYVYNPCMLFFREFQCNYVL